jgi:RNA polymerase sigma factor (sigma-70 family)
MRRRSRDRETDEALVARAQADPDGPGGRSAVESLFARYDERVYAWCRRFVRDPERALELAQDAMLLAYRGIGGFEGRSRFSSWLFAITRRQCWREGGRPAPLLDDEADPDSLPSDQPDPGDDLERREEQARLLEMLEGVLGDQERLALWLRCHEEMTVGEITSLLGLTSASGARTLLQTARRKLRAELERRRKGEKS